ncbi:MAG: hypothetical protein ABIJ50_11570 [Pseudomonadota bacterium]
MGLLGAIDKLLEPITQRIFATNLGKSIRPMTAEELFADRPNINSDASYSSLSGTDFHQSWIDMHDDE